MLPKTLFYALFSFFDRSTEVVHWLNCDFHNGCGKFIRPNVLHVLCQAQKEKPVILFVDEGIIQSLQAVGDGFDHIFGSIYGNTTEKTTILLYFDH